MVTSYLRMALRVLRKRVGYTFINVFGLGIGAAVCLLMLVFIQDERSYDRFHEKAERTYRLTDHFALAGRTYNTAGTPFPWGPALQATFPEIEAMVRVLKTGNVVDVDNNRFVESNIFYADSNFFAVFDFTLRQGNPQTALQAPNTVVLTEAMAYKYFGDVDPMGQALVVGDTDTYTVTGVLEDYPSNSHFYPDFLVSFTSYSHPMIESWTRHVANYTFLVLPEDYDVAALEAQLPAFLSANMPPELVEQRNYRPQLQPLTDIHLHSDLFFEAEPNGSITYVYLFSAIAFFILLIACINFINLATARSVERAREVGLRKVMGAHRNQLIGQFLGESTLLSLLVLGLAIIVAQLGRPLLSDLVGRELVIQYNASVLLGLATIGVFIGLVAGSYPALFLSRFQPALVLKGSVGAQNRGGLLRKGLVIFQFSISIILIAGTTIIYHQLQYLEQKELGFQDEQVVLVPMGGAEVQTNREAIKAELQQSAYIEEVATSSSVPGWGFPQQIFRPKGMPSDEQLILPVMVVDHDFLLTYDMELIDGRGFSRDFPTDSSAFVINEAAAQKLGWHNGAVGQTLEWWRGSGSSSFALQKEGPVVGVVKDFHFQSLHETIQPLIFHIQPDGYGVFSIRVRLEGMTETLAVIEQTIKTYSPQHLFDYSFMEDEFAALYESEQQLGRIFIYFAVLAIVIACLGLFGLASFVTAQRTKEVGIRKVLGATESGILALLATDFMKLVGAAALLAIPIAYFSMDRWLDNFAFRVDLGVGTFLFAVTLALFIALATVGYHVLKSVRANPVDSLRYE